MIIIERFPDLPKKDSPSERMSCPFSCPVICLMEIHTKYELFQG